MQCVRSAAFSFETHTRRNMKRRQRTRRDGAPRSTRGAARSPGDIDISNDNTMIEEATETDKINKNKVMARFEYLRTHVENSSVINRTHIHGNNAC